jgi:uncharacterized membrane protein YdcZ (DUF606 family)
MGNLAESVSALIYGGISLGVGAIVLILITSVSQRRDKRHSPPAN